MKRQITIALHDSNLFFLQGMQYIFKMYFHHKGIPVVFTLKNETQGADLVVTSSSTWRPYESIQHKMTIRRINCFGEYSYHQRAISQCEKPESVILLLDELFNTSVNELSLKNTVNDDVGIRITRREKEILREIITELPVIRIAKKLQISVKTVSTHKLSVMRKLGFRNSQELYIWLLKLKNL